MPYLLEKNPVYGYPHTAFWGFLEYPLRDLIDQAGGPVLVDLLTDCRFWVLEAAFLSQRGHPYGRRRGRPPKWPQDRRELVRVLGGHGKVGRRGSWRLADLVAGQYPLTVRVRCSVRSLPDLSIYAVENGNNSGAN